MAVTITSCSTAILATYSILQIMHLWHPDFYKRFSRKVFQVIGGFDQKKKLGTSLKANF